MEFMPNYGINKILQIQFIFTLYFIFFITKANFLSFICKSNNNNCSKCNPITNKCEICNYPDIFLPDEYGGCKGALNCFSGKNYCNLCEQNGKLCKVCDKGFTPDENGGCTYSYNCKISYKGNCLECKENYFQYGKTGGFQICKSYSSKDLIHCTNINFETGFCNICEKGYFLSSENKCLKTENCAESLFENCISCKDGFYLDYSKGECLEKYDNFTLCKQAFDNKTCELCENYNYFDGNKICIPFNYCSKSINHTCIECVKGFYLTQENSACTYTQNCFNGDKDFGICVKCKDNFYLDGSDYICKTNKEENEFKFCTKTRDDGRCIECEEYYYVGEDYKCSFTKNCSKSILGKCLLCSKNFYLGYDNKCTTIEHCIYSSNDYCIECEEGFYFNRKKKTCKEYNDNSKYNNCKYSCEYAEKCCKCKDNFYLKKSDNSCIKNTEYGPFYKCSESDSEGDYCIDCIEPYFLGIDDNLCSLVEACAKIENEFRCKECIEFYCLDANKGICIENDLVENEAYKIYYACNYTNKEGNACEKCLNGYEVGEEGYCIDIERCIDRNREGICLKCKVQYCSNDVYGCIESHFANCLRCNNLYDLYSCTECLEGYKVNIFGGCDSQRSNEVD